MALSSKYAAGSRQFLTLKKEEGTMKTKSLLVGVAALCLILSPVMGLTEDWSPKGSIKRKFNLISEKTLFFFKKRGTIF
jgi:hypothetical protein